MELQQYPEVRWFGRKGVFEELLLGERYREQVQESKNSRSSLYLFRPRMILINDLSEHHINEKCAHYLHFVTSGLSLYGKSREDWFSLNVLIEMFGFLGSKLLNPSRKFQYENCWDFFKVLDKDDSKGMEKLELLKTDPEFDFSEFIFHQQGYLIAERMFYALHAGDLNLKEVQRLFRKSFEKPGSATRKYLELRTRFVDSVGN